MENKENKEPEKIIEDETSRAIKIIADIANRDFAAKGDSSRLGAIQDVLRRLNVGEIQPDQAIKEAKEISISN